jgi:hypothetical protein
VDWEYSVHKYRVLSRSLSNRVVTSYTKSGYNLSLPKNIVLGESNTSHLRTLYAQVLDIGGFAVKMAVKHRYIFTE